MDRIPFSATNSGRGAFLFSFVMLCSFVTAFAASNVSKPAASARDTALASPRIRQATTAISAVVLADGTLAFSTGYNDDDWSGILTASKLMPDGSAGSTMWDAGGELDDASPGSRIILSSRLASNGTFSGGMPFRNFADLDTAAQRQLMLPASTNVALDNGQARVEWLRGDRASEKNGAMRPRRTLLGAIVRSQAVYVASPDAGYRNNWPPLANGARSPETIAAATPDAGTNDTSYAQFVSRHVQRLPVVYVGANDGMLHAFDASQSVDGSNTPSSGKELWAYVPRSAYGNLGNLTRRNNFSFASTVDGTPVVRDVFFQAASTSPATTARGWHTLLVGGLGHGGRGIYALDVTDPDPANADGVSEASAASKVLWEFNAGMPSVGPIGNGAGGENPGGNPADLGYTYGQPNIARLANGRWVVLVPSGYFPACNVPGSAADCASDGVAYHANSALFVLDAQTGTLLAELKIPDTIPGLKSQGLSSPVLGDYNDDQIDDVAFAGDVNGNLWRFDLTDANPANWASKITLAYRAAMPGAQPITVMPRLFPDPVTNRFIVVFGTGGYIESGSSATDESTQAVYGIRDTGSTVTGTDGLVQQTLADEGGSDSHCGDAQRSLTSRPVPPGAGGWYFNLIAPGERVVATPGALPDTNRAVITTLIPAGAGCPGDTKGTLMVVDAATGGAGDAALPADPGAPADGKEKTGMVGGGASGTSITGILPVATVVGGGKLVFPGVVFGDGKAAVTGNSLWRRRSWRMLHVDQ